MDFFIKAFVTLSVLEDIVRLIPTEKMTPATVYSVFKTSFGMSMHVSIDITVAVATAINKNISIFLIALAKI